MIDLHFHLLPGIDDGPADVAASVALARAARAEGITTIVATPHVDHTHGVDPATIRPRLNALMEDLATADAGVEVVPGAEVAVTRSFELDGGELEHVVIGPGPWVLLECPLIWERALEGAALRLRRHGKQVVLAHPERSPGIAHDPSRLQRLVEEGCLASITDASLRGRFGRPVRDVALTLMQRALVHNVTSDAHDAKERRPGLRAGLEAAEEHLAGVDELAGWLTHDVPLAIITGAAIPPRPDVELRPTRRGLFRRRGTR